MYSSVPAAKSFLEPAALLLVNQPNSGSFDEPSVEQSSPLYQPKPAIGDVMPKQSTTKAVGVSNSPTSDVPVRRSTRVRYLKKIYEPETGRYVVKDT